MSDAPMLLFSTSCYGALRERMLAVGGLEAGQVQTRLFPDGERYLRLVSEVAGRDVALVGGTVSEAATLELYDLACGLVEYGARSLSLVVPFFGYSTMERAVLPREVVTAKTRARLLSSLPGAEAGNRIFLLDLHSEGIPYYFEGGMHPHHVYAKPVILETARRLGVDGLVMACTDAGRAKWVESLANDLGVDASFVFKRRHLDGTVELTAMAAHVEDKHVFLYDDMIRTGGSLLNAARAYRQAGARRITAMATHGLFPDDALERLQGSGLFDALITTDSHPRALELQARGLQVESVAPLLVEHLRSGV